VKLNQDWFHQLKFFHFDLHQINQKYYLTSLSFSINKVWQKYQLTYIHFNYIIYFQVHHFSPLFSFLSFDFASLHFHINYNLLRFQPYCFFSLNIQINSIHLYFPPIFFLLLIYLFILHYIIQIIYWSLHHENFL
jgi:hypothetical protein